MLFVCITNISADAHTLIILNTNIQHHLLLLNAYLYTLLVLWMGKIHLHLPPFPLLTSRQPWTLALRTFWRPASRTSPCRPSTCPPPPRRTSWTTTRTTGARGRGPCSPAARGWAWRTATRPRPRPSPPPPRCCRWARPTPPARPPCLSSRTLSRTPAKRVPRPFLSSLSTYHYNAASSQGNLGV